MLSEGMLKHEFIVQTIEWGLNKLRQVQLAQLLLMRSVITERHFDWQELYDSISGRSESIIGSNGHYRIVIPVEKRLRFADMKRFSTGGKGPNAKVYNRPTWGVLFGRDDSVKTRLREGISDSLRENLLSQLRQAVSDNS